MKGFCSYVNDSVTVTVSVIHLFQILVFRFENVLMNR